MWKVIVFELLLLDQKWYILQTLKLWFQFKFFVIVPLDIPLSPKHSGHITYEKKKQKQRKWIWHVRLLLELENTKVFLFFNGISASIFLKTGPITTLALDGLE